MPATRPPRPLIVGHRGAPALAPENTPESFVAAFAAGADWIELDARRTADDNVVVHHDPHLPDGRNIVDLDIGACQEAGVWSLVDVLAGLPAGLGVDLEIKNLPGEPDHDENMSVVAASATIVGDHLGHRPAIVTSFNPLAVMAARESRMDLPVGLLTAYVPFATGLQAAQELGCAWICPGRETDDMDTSSVAAAHDAGLQVLVWTVDDPAAARHLAALGVDAICSNDPGTIKAAIGPASS